MRKDTYELEFEKFLEDENYEAAEDVLFSTVRAAFEAGWRAENRRGPGIRSRFRKKHEIK